MPSLVTTGHERTLKMPSNRGSKRSSGNRNSKAAKPIAAHQRELTEEESRSFSSQPTTEVRDTLTAGRNLTPGGPLGRIVGRIRAMFSRGQASKPAASGHDREVPIATTMETAAPRPDSGRAPRRETDVSAAQLKEEYTPTQTSLKGSFRDDGSARQRDQEFTVGALEERFNDEDHYTNKSNDPRIGTHSRTYEAGEAPPKPGE